MDKDFNSLSELQQYLINTPEYSLSANDIDTPQKIVDILKDFGNIDEVYAQCDDHMGLNIISDIGNKDIEDVDQSIEEDSDKEDLGEDEYKDYSDRVEDRDRILDVGRQIINALEKPDSNISSLVEDDRISRGQHPD